MGAINLVSLPVFFLVLSSLVFVHELGHFLAARWVGVPVEEFGVGFPPRLVGVVRDAAGKWRVFFGMKAPKPQDLGGPSTIYSFNALPIGGFVRPAGEEDPSVPGGFSSAPKRSRIIVLAAGPLFNLVFAFLVFAAGFMLGWPETQTDKVSISAVVADGPAALAGLQPKDIIVRLDTQSITAYQQVSDYIRNHLGQPILFVVDRNGQPLEFTITPRTEWPEGQGPTGIVLGSPYVVTRYSLPQAVVRAGQEMHFQFDTLIHLPSLLIQRQISLDAARPCGPKCLYDVTDAAVVTAQREQEAFPIVQLIGLISVALAVTNLLPIPALDGGRILFVLIEAVRGRRMDPMREAMVNMVSMMLLLGLMAAITINDFVNPIIPR
jgi:regulator of sigma E protease